eukprot:TRINITY_DN19594_c0_g1_i1.p1 TRINITY_DN19594_c0_g1~~TRINITY_DN19594_c0_g1_i1.p1  ORF type:complete len:113 (-),score=4.22 TRINITY_DN19594_c0_g1_i1:20-358(-)
MVGCIVLLPALLVTLIEPRGFDASQGKRKINRKRGRREEEIRKLQKKPCPQNSNLRPCYRPMSITSPFLLWQCSLRGIGVCDLGKEERRRKSRKELKQKIIANSIVENGGEG